MNNIACGQSGFSHLESILRNGFKDFLEGHFRGECVAVVDDRFTFVSVPAVQLHRATALIQSPDGDRDTTCIKQDDQSR